MKKLFAYYEFVLTNHCKQGKNLTISLNILVLSALVFLLSASSKAQIASSGKSISSALGGGGVHKSADPKLIPAGQKLLNWLYTLPGKSDNKVISGQYHMSAVNTIHSQTGIWVGLMGDLFNNSRQDAWNDFTPGLNNRQDMLDHWNAGGIVTVHMPIPNIKNRSSNADSDFSNDDMVAAVTPGSQINKNLNEWLTGWAVHAQWLSDRSVPLIIRPLHEMNCCFWYGNKTYDNFKNLYRYIFTYLTQTENLHNLLFGFTPVSYKGPWAEYYPGDEYVDLVGIDLYQDITGGKQLMSSRFDGYKTLLPLGKPFALSEFGPKSGTRPSKEHSDYREMIRAIKVYCPEAVYWFSWSVEWSMDGAYNDNVKELLKDPWVINRDEIPKF